MNQKKDILKSIVVLTVICLVTSAALAVVNHFTAPVSAANAAAREEDTRRTVMKDAAEFQALSEIAFSEDILGAYAGKDAMGATLGYIFTVQGKGFGGPITVMCAIDTNDRIIACSTLDVSGETKTLGGRVADEAYTGQYAGSNAALDGVETISGATVTSKAYEDCVKAAFEACAVVKGAGA